jgi:hypothetical protein
MRSAPPALLLLVWASTALAGCNPSLTQKPQTSEAMPQSASAVSDCREGDLDEGLVELSGVVARTKGAQIILGGVILGQAGQSLAEGLVGKHITVRGRRCVYVCHPQEQCLTSGQIPYLSSLTLVPHKQTRPTTRALRAPHRGPIDLED